MTNLTAFSPLNTFNNFNERFVTLDRTVLTDGRFIATGDRAELIAEGDFVGTLAGGVAGTLEAFELTVHGTPALSASEISADAGPILDYLASASNPILQRGLQILLEGDDYILGSGFTDVVVGSTGNDRIHLRKGADFFYTGLGDGAAGNDTVRGGDDDALDTLVFGAVPSSLRRNFEDILLTPIEGGVEAHDLIDGSTDRFFGFERFVFGTQDYSLEEILVPKGQEMTAAQTATLIFETFIGRYFGHRPETYEVGFNETIDRLHDGVDRLEVIEEFYENDVGWTNLTARSLLVGGDFVSNLYQVVLDRSGDADGVAHWKGQLESGELTRPELIERFLFSRERLGEGPGEMQLVEREPGVWDFDG